LSNNKNKEPSLPALSNTDSAADVKAGSASSFPLKIIFEILAWLAHFKCAHTEPQTEQTAFL